MSDEIAQLETAVRLHAQAAEIWKDRALLAEGRLATIIEECARVADARHVGLVGLRPRGWAMIQSARTIAAEIRAKVGAK